MVSFATITAGDTLELALQALAERRLRPALDLLDRAESAGLDPDLCSGYRWTCWMLAGRFEEAWRESDRTSARGRPDPFRLWDGLPFTGKRVLIRCLHGYGDAIQFIRYARSIQRDAARVIIQTHPQLVSLMRAMPFAAEVVTWSGNGDDVRGWDQQIEVMELPRAFRTTLNNIPCPVPYVHVPVELRRTARVPFTPSQATRIGLQWGAGEWDASRSMPFVALRPILSLPEFQFYSFQRGAACDEWINSEPRERIVDVSGNSPDIIEAAADLMNIDLLITVDTMLAHLAGALGKPVWVLLPYHADWRWMLHRCDTPWYPTMRLFRQQSPGAWQPVVQQVRAALLR